MLKTEVGALKDKLAKQVQRKAASQPKPAVKQPKTKAAKAAAAARIVSRARAVGGTATKQAFKSTAAARAAKGTAVAKNPPRAQRAAPRTEAVAVAAEPAGEVIVPALEGASGGS